MGKSVDTKNITGAVLMDLSKAFDCISQDLHISKPDAYGLSIDRVIFIYSYAESREWKQAIQKICLKCIFWRDVFLDDLLLFVTEAKLANFADGNTFYATNKDI